MTSNEKGLIWGIIEFSRIKCLPIRQIKCIKVMKWFNLGLNRNISTKVMYKLNMDKVISDEKVPLMVKLEFSTN